MFTFERACCALHDFVQPVVMPGGDAAQHTSAFVASCPAMSTGFREGEHQVQFVGGVCQQTSYMLVCVNCGPHSHFDNEQRWLHFRSWSFRVDSWRLFIRYCVWMLLFSCCFRVICDIGASRRERSYLSCFVCTEAGCLVCKPFSL